MSRIYEHDIKKLICEKLQNEFNPMIDTIRNEREDSSIPHANNITYTELIWNYPEIMIDIDGESLLDPDKELLTDNLCLLPEIFPIKISVMIKTASTEITAYADYYNEAFKRILHGCNLEGITWCRVLSTIQQEVIDENLQTYKNCGVNLEVRVN